MFSYQKRNTPVIQIFTTGLLPRTFLLCWGDTLLKVPCGSWPFHGLHHVCIHCMIMTDKQFPIHPWRINPENCNESARKLAAHSLRLYVVKLDANSTSSVSRLFPHLFSYYPSLLWDFSDKGKTVKVNMYKAVETALLKSIHFRRACELVCTLRSFWICSSL